jgi:hypothetical protein
VSAEPDVIPPVAVVSTASPAGSAPPAKPTRQERKAAKKLPADSEPKPVPHIPGLEDPDKDALWATHRTEEPSGWRHSLNSTTTTRKLIAAAIVSISVLAVFLPAIATIMLLIPGIAAVILAGLSLLDPAYTRFLPGSMSEIRLMTLGIGVFGASLLIASIF